MKKNLLSSIFSSTTKRIILTAIAVCLGIFMFGCSDSSSGGASGDGSGKDGSQDGKSGGSKKHSKRHGQKRAKTCIINLPNDVKLELVEVEPGTFTMSKKDGENYAWEVEHTKKLTKTFYIGKYEVTQEQWQAVMGTDISDLQKKGKTYGKITEVEKNQPMYFVSWYEAMSFCEKMNKYAPKGWKFTLPTESQWEFAARGGNNSKGYKYSGSNNLDDVGWHLDNSGKNPHVVGSKKPNELGLYDMSGNVSEWCLDNFENSSDKTKAEFRRSYGDKNNANRVFCGGCWGSDMKSCRSASVSCGAPDTRYSYVGIRLALVPAR